MLKVALLDGPSDFFRLNELALCSRDTADKLSFFRLFLECKVDRGGDSVSFMLAHCRKKHRPVSYSSKEISFCEDVNNTDLGGIQNT